MILPTIHEVLSEPEIYVTPILLRNGIYPHMSVSKIEEPLEKGWLKTVISDVRREADIVKRVKREVERQTPKNKHLLPTNEAIFLYFWSLRPPLAIVDLGRLKFRDKESSLIFSQIHNNSNPKYRKPIPPCKNPDRYHEAVEGIDKILAVIPMYAGGRDAVWGYLHYQGVLTTSGRLRQWKENH